MPKLDTKYCHCCGNERYTVSQFRNGSAVCMLCEMLPAVEVCRMTRETVARESIAAKHIHSSAKDGRIAAALARYESEGGKQCCACHARKPVTEYDKCAPRGDGLQPNCRSCNKLYTELRTQPGGKALWLTVREAMRAKTAAENAPSTPSA